MVYSRGDQERAIVLLVRALNTGRFYTNLELKDNQKICKYADMVTHICGKMKFGESILDAMAREGIEESGVDFTGKIRLPKEQTLDFPNQHGWPIDWGYTETEDEFEGKPTDRDVKFNRWMTRSELMALSFEKRQIRLEAKPALEACLTL